MQPPPLREFARIAVVQTAYTGDVALALPLMEALRQLHRESWRAMVVLPSTAELAACAAAVDEVLVFDKRGAHRGVAGLRWCAEQLRRRGVELLLVPHRSARSALLAWMARPRCAVGMDRSALPWLLPVRVPYRWDLHEVERNLSLLEPFPDIGERWRCYAQARVELRFAPHHREHLQRCLEELGIPQRQPLVVLAPGSVWQTKRWSARQYARLARWLLRRDIAVVLTGTAAESELCRSIAQEGGGWSLAGRLGLPELLLLLERACCVVSNDSAPIHLAELVQTPVVAVFGPTIPMFGFGPRLPSSAVVERELPCRPCSLHGGRRCPLGTHACMEELPAEWVWERLEPLLPA
jgi:heptosyltransferase-2